MKKNNSLSDILFVAVQLVWGLPQTLLGFIVFLLNTGERHYIFNGAVLTESSKIKGGVSLGLFIFTEKGNADRLSEHEYGHCIQSAILGPFYLFVIGIESFLWSLSVSGRPYDSFYTEKWANVLASQKFGKDVHLS